MKYQYVYYLLLIGLVFHIIILRINGPLWDDWTLEGLSFNDLALQFRGNGLYYGGLAHLHYFINSVDGEGVWFSRLLSLVCLLNVPLLLFFTLTELSFGRRDAFQVSALTTAIPLFGNAFGEIVLPYLICLNLFLFATLLIAKFLTGQQHHWLLAVAALSLFVSFVTNSLLFYSLPVVFIILVRQWIKTREIKSILKVAALLVVLITSFFAFKSSYLVPQAGSPYAVADYNSFGLRDLILDGPIRTVKYLVSYPITFGNEAFEILSDRFNLLLFLGGVSLLGITFTAKKNGRIISLKSRRSLLTVLGVGFLLLVAAVYPYAVVRKFSDSLFSYNERHNLLIPIGAGLSLFSLLNLILGANQVKYAYAVVIPLFLILKLNVLGYFAVKADVQQIIANELNAYVTHHQLDNQSILFIDTLDDNHGLEDWSFYEYGGMIRSRNLPENKVFVPQSLVKRSGFGKPQLNIKGNTSLFIENDNYGISLFDTNRYEVKKYDIVLDVKDHGYLWQALTDFKAKIIISD